MKKTFPLTHPKTKPERLVEAIRSEVNKYLKRERRKDVPEGFDFWDFDCRIGENAETAKVMHVSELSKAIGESLTEEAETCYVEILARASKRMKKDNVS
jgi:hypothetical protein|tara:strand:- start:5144 stop:5440 length:297 start_codon:yes stop_codon:yes gene_type:complete